VRSVGRRRLRIAAATATVVVASVMTLAESGSGEVRAATSTGAVTPGQRAAAAPVGSDPRWPSSIANRKVLDQHGDVYLIRTFSSWGMASNLSDTDITSALEGIAADGFNGVTVWIGGGADYSSEWSPRYQHKATGENFWTGTPWASSLGPAWGSLDHLVSEAQRLGIVVWMSLNGGFGTSGARADWEAVNNANMYDAGAAIAARYRSAPNVGWHVMLDDGNTPDSTEGQRVDAFFKGVNDTEGATTRPVRWLEAANGASTSQKGWLRTTSFNATINTWYDYGSNSTEIAEAGYAQVTSVPVGDCEPPYDGAPHYGGDVGQQLRERSYATFVEGGSVINYGHEDWWPFGLPALYSEGLTWRQVPAHSHTVQQSYAWTLLDQFVADRTWIPDDGSFLTAGAGAGDTKSAAGRSDTAAVAYIPSSRTVVVNTTVIAGTDPVRVRWYDPTTGTFSTIAASEAQQANRTVAFPAAHADGSDDWVLVVDLANGTTSPPTTTTTTSPTTTSTTTTAPSSTSTTTTAPTTTTTSPGTTSAEPAFVQEVAQREASGVSNSVTFPDANQAGDLIVVYVLWSNTGDVAVTDTNGNTYLPAGTATSWNGGRARAAVFYAANIASGPNTVTATFATPLTDFGIVYAHEYTNVATTSPLDGATSAAGTTANVTSGPLTTTSDGGLLFVAAGSTARVELTDPTYSTRSNLRDNVTGDSIGQPAGTHTATGTHNGTAWVINLVAFKPAPTTTA
jgi:hypothetical protein